MNALRAGGALALVGLVGLAVSATCAVVAAGVIAARMLARREQERELRRRLKAYEGAVRVTGKRQAASVRRFP